MERGLVMSMTLVVGGFLMGCMVAEVVNRWEGKA